MIVNGLTALATLGGLVVLVGSLTRGERLRRRLKAHVEILGGVPDGEDADRMREIVALDVSRLHRLVFPRSDDELRRASNLMLASELIFAAVLIPMAFTTFSGGILLGPDISKETALTIVAPLSVLSMAVAYFYHRARLRGERADRNSEDDSST